MNASGPKTIQVPLGDYLSLAIDAVLTGNPNPDAGVTIGEPAQPAYLGLQSLALGISSSDSAATFLTPIANNSAPLSIFRNPVTGVTSTTFVGFGVLNAPSGSTGIPFGPIGGGSGLHANGGGGVVPTWTDLSAPADVQPNLPGFDPGAGDGDVGLSGYIDGSNRSIGSVNGSQQFAPQNNTASYSTATEFTDSIIFRGISNGTVTLTPYVVNSASGYWTLKTPAHTVAGSSGVSSVASAYSSKSFSAADTINNLPALVVEITEPPHLIPDAVVSLTASANDPSTITNGTGDHQGTFSPVSPKNLTITGGNGAYSIAEVTGINGDAGDVSGDINASGWNPATDKEIFAVDVEVYRVQASAAQLITLITEIAGDSAYNVLPSVGVVASLTDPTNPQVFAGLDNATTSYNLFLTFAGGGPGAADALELDLGDGYTLGGPLVGYTFTAVAVVPEPASLGILALGGFGIIARRNRGKMGRA